MTAVKLKRETISKKELEAFDTARFKNSRYEVGIVDPKLAYPDGTTVLDVAIWNEFGTSRIPERPAMRKAIIKATPELRRIGQRQAALILNGKLTQQQAVINNCKLLVKAIQAEILKLKDPPNAPSTIRQKGFDDPLIETGLYHDSISFKLGKG